MKEKDKKTISIVCLIAGFIITLFVVQLIYTLTLRQWLDHKTAKAFLNIGWIYFCMYVYYSKLRCNDGETKDFAGRTGRED